VRVVLQARRGDEQALVYHGRADDGHRGQLALADEVAVRGVDQHEVAVVPQAGRAYLGSLDGDPGEAFHGVVDQG
jgi:hypothetical protein